MSKDTNIWTTPGYVDPVANGASLQIYNTGGTGDAVCLPLPAAGWSTAGSVATSGGFVPSFKYKDAGFASGPCRVARVKHQRLLKVVCQSATQPIAYTLDEAAQGKVTVRFRSAGTTYCVEFAGVDAKVDRTGKFLGSATILTSCPLAPTTCS